MRKLLALLAACFYLMQADGALAASYEVCCADECKSAQCISAGCMTCATAAIAAVNASRLRLQLRQAAPPWTERLFIDPLQEVWRPPD